MYFTELIQSFIDGIPEVLANNGGIILAGQDHAELRRNHQEPGSGVADIVRPDPDDFVRIEKLAGRFFIFKLGEPSPVGLSDSPGFLVGWYTSLSLQYARLIWLE